MSKPFQLAVGGLLLLIAAFLAFLGIVGPAAPPSFKFVAPLLPGLLGLLLFQLGLRNPIPPEHRVWFRREWAFSNLVKGLAMAGTAGALVYLLNTQDLVPVEAGLLLYVVIAWGLHVALNVRKTVCARCGSDLELGRIGERSVEYCPDCGDVLVYTRDRPQSLMLGAEAQALLAKVERREAWEIEKRDRSCRRRGDDEPVLRGRSPPRAWCSRPGWRCHEEGVRHLSARVRGDPSILLGPPTPRRGRLDERHPV